VIIRTVQGPESLLRGRRPRGRGLGTQAPRDRRQLVEPLGRWHGGQSAVSPAPPEDREDLAAAPSRRGREDRAGAVAVVALADWLCFWPLAPARVEPGDAVGRKRPIGREVDHIVEVDLDLPDRPWESPRWRDARFGGVPVPLGPDRRLRVAEVDRADDAPALPSAIGGLIGPEERLRVDACDPEPGAADVDATRRRLLPRARRLPNSIAQANDSFSSSATTFETSR
jgi:hypothetical protein